MAKTLYVFTDLSPMNLSIDLYDIGTNIMTRQHEKHIKIIFPKKEVYEKIIKKYYTDNTKTEKITATKQKT